MDVGNRDTLILPVPPEPFALIVGAAMQGGSDDRLETSLRHMGLRPERRPLRTGSSEAAKPWARLAQASRPRAGPLSAAASMRAR